MIANKTQVTEHHSDALEGAGAVSLVLPSAECSAPEPEAPGGGARWRGVAFGAFAA
jgi:hypothetical protein